MTTKTRKKTTNKTAGQVDAFMAFQARIRSLDFAKRESLRLKARGEEILTVLAEWKPAAEAWRDNQLRAPWETMLEETFDQYAAAMRKLCWELEEADLV